VVEELSGKAGASVLYSDFAIQTMATVKAVYRLAGRQCQGLLESIFELMGIDLPVPDPSTLCRRLGQLSIELPVVPKEGARHLVVDSTGVKVYIEQVSTDGAYDHRHCYDEIEAKGAKAVIPPRKDAKIWQHGNRQGKPHPRDESLRHIRKHGRKRSKQESGYHRRSIAETTMFRFKTIFGGHLSARQFDNQAVELFIKCAALNRMIQSAKPDSYKVEA
jgi:hypothetical protein